MTHDEAHLELVPDGNIRAYAYIYAIEVGLRELIVDSFRTLEGYSWYKRRLAPDILQKYRDGRTKEKATPWTQFVHHDPLYYIDFPDLIKVMDTGTNWRDVFQDMFGTKDVFLGGLKSLLRKYAMKSRIIVRSLRVICAC